MIPDQSKGRHKILSRPSLLTLAFRPSSVSPHRSPAPTSLRPTCIQAGILDCQVRVGFGLIVIGIVGICDVVCPVMIVIFVLYRTVVMYNVVVYVVNMYVFVIVIEIKS